VSGIAAIEPVVVGAGETQGKPPAAHTAGRAAARTMLAQQGATSASSANQPKRGLREARGGRRLLTSCASWLQHQKSSASRRDDSFTSARLQVVDPVFAEVIRADIGDQLLRLGQPRAASQNARARSHDRGLGAAPRAARDAPPAE